MAAPGPKRSAATAPCSQPAESWPLVEAMTERGLSAESTVKVTPLPLLLSLESSSPLVRDTQRIVALQKANRYLDEHPRAQVATQQRQLAARLETLNVAEWLKLEVSEQRLLLTRNTAALEATAQLDGCYVVETDLKRAQADAQTIHDRYKDLALVERDFRTLKTGHLESRPWFVCTEDNTQAHVLTAMLALKVRRHLETQRAFAPRGTPGRHSFP